MTARPPSWDKYEAVILLEGFLSSINGEISRSDATKRVSQDLRKMALSRGIEIDEIYRNENGISFQMKSMESAYYGHTLFKPATRLFTEVADLYHASTDDYHKLLKEAKAMISEKNTVEDDFMQYLANKVSPAQLSKFYRCYSEIEAFCLKTKVLQKPLFMTTDSDVIKKVQRTIAQNKIFRVTHRKQLGLIVEAGRYYYNYIEKDLYPQFSDVTITTNENTSTNSIQTEAAITDTPDAEESVVVQLVRNEQDECLLQKYPIAYKIIFCTLKDALSESAAGLSVGDMCEKIGRIARPAVVEEILDNASWAMSVNDNYVFSIEMVDHEVVVNEKDKEVVAFAMSAAEINNISFSQFMRDTLKLAEATCRSYSSAINNCETFAREHQLSSWRLYSTNKKEAQETVRLLLNNADFLDYNSRQHNRFRAALQKFLIFIGSDYSPVATVEKQSESEAPYRNEAYEGVLIEYFKKGFRLDSPLEIRKFRRYYTALHTVELTDTDEEVVMKIKQLCIVYEGKAFLPEVMLSEELKEKLLKYIEDAFDSGKSAIYYQAIYAEFAEVFLDYHIHDADMLKSYLMHVGNGRFFTNRSFVSREPNVVLDPLAEIRSCLQSYGRPVEYEELFNSLPHLPQAKIKFILASNGEFVNNGHGAYFHESTLRLSDEELAGIAEIIQQTIVEKDFIGGNELYEAIKAKYPYIIEDNHNLSVYGFRDALKAKLGDEFSFKGNIISRSGQELSMADVFTKYARNHDSFTLLELQGLANNLATVIYFEPVYENSLRISQNQFVSKNAAQFSVPDIDDALDRVCTGKYISIQGVTNFGIFPYAGFTWNSFLLEHYVANYSQKYMLIHSSFNGTECVGAIVKRSAGISSFDDLIVDLLVNNSIEMKKAAVLQFLSDQGYLARRRYAEIESLIIKANAQRQRKDTI